jgi:hypothetical protein
MRYLAPVILALLSAVSPAAAAPTIEVIPPAAIDDQLRAVWIVVVTNSGEHALDDLYLYVSLSALPGRGDQIVSAPPECVAQFGNSSCHLSLAPNERRALTYAVQYTSRFALLTGIAQTDSARARSEALFAHEFPVTNFDDAGPGSLRQAILDVNAACATEPEPCAVVFHLDGPVPAVGWFTLRPRSPLPNVAGTFTFIDGSSQTRHTGDTNAAGPELMLDGSLAGSGHGLLLAASDVTVNDLAIGNFPGNGIEARTPLATRVLRTYSGVDPTGLNAAPNGSRGVLIEGGAIDVEDGIFSHNVRSGGWFVSNTNVTIVRNRFTHNGASGFYSNTPVPPPNHYPGITVRENILAYNAHAGISLAREATGNYAANHFVWNAGRAIDIGIDGPTLGLTPGLPGRGGIVGAPHIVSMTYENGETIIEAAIAPRSPNTYFGETVYFYVSTGPKDGGILIGANDENVRREEGRYIFRFHGDLRGYWLSVANFTTYVYQWDDPAPGSSEINEPVLMQ